MQTTAYAREQMIEQQVRAWDVLDERVLDVMRKVPRELFVPPGQRYRDARFERMLSVGGRLFVVVGAAPVMDARLVTRISEDSVTTRSLFETVIDPLVNAARPAEFTF